MEYGTCVGLVSRVQRLTSWKVGSDNNKGVGGASSNEKEKRTPRITQRFDHIYFWLFCFGTGTPQDTKDITVYESKKAFDDIIYQTDYAAAQTAGTHNNPHPHCREGACNLDDQPLRGACNLGGQPLRGAPAGPNTSNMAGFDVL